MKQPKGLEPADPLDNPYEWAERNGFAGVPGLRATVWASGIRQHEGKIMSLLRHSADVTIVDDRRESPFGRAATA